MQDMTSPIQPLTNAPKKHSCWLYGLATVGGCAIIVVGIITAFVINFVRNVEDGNFQFSNTYTDPTTGEEVTVTTTYNLLEAMEGGISIYQLLQDADISLADVQSQDPEVLEACMHAELGEARVVELYNGGIPTESDVAALRTCVK